MDTERVEAIFDEISLLVLEADAAGLAEKVAALAGAVRDRARRVRRGPVEWRASMNAVIAALSSRAKIDHSARYAGFAAIVGLGVLSLLYFAQAREVKRLREWAGRAPERDADLAAARRRARPSSGATVPGGRRRPPPRQAPARAPDPAGRRPAARAPPPARSPCDTCGRDARRRPAPPRRQQLPPRGSGDGRRRGEERTCSPAGRDTRIGGAAPVARPRRARRRLRPRTPRPHARARERPRPQPRHPPRPPRRRRPRAAPSPATTAAAAAARRSGRRTPGDAPAARRPDAPRPAAAPVRATTSEAACLPATAIPAARAARCSASCSAAWRSSRSPSS